MRYAAYGSNLHPLRLSERISSARLVGTGNVPDWSLHFHKRSNDGSGKCSILAGGDGIHVAVFDVSSADKLVLDRIEGLNVGYAETSLSVVGVGDCVAYIAETSHVDDSLLPYDWYKELVLSGARFHGFPESYLDGISQQPACLDPDPVRRLRGYKTVALVKSGT